MKNQTVLSAFGLILAALLLLAFVFLLHNFIWSSFELLQGKAVNSFPAAKFSIQ